MTSGGNTKQRLAFYGAVFFFVAALILALMLHAAPLALVSFVLGIMCCVGTWTLGLARSNAADNDQWMTAIK